ncbi:MAG: hypothetical protein DRP62_06850 [Planctomycetota bacterium]|nr:MAG: hypothetical protein DRP62_06850 [Planctomycetota bacterium]
MAPFGTTAVREVSVQIVGEASPGGKGPVVGRKPPQKNTLPVAEPKLEPEMVTVFPVVVAWGEIEEIWGTEPDSTNKVEVE